MHFFQFLNEKNKVVVHIQFQFQYLFILELSDTPGVDFIKLGAERKALRPTFEKLFTGVEVGRRRRAQMDRAISMICAVCPTFMKSTPGVDFINYFAPYAQLLRSFLLA